MDSSSLLGSAYVEVKADLSKLVGDFARAKAQSQAFGNDVSKAFATTAQPTGKFIDNMVTVNRWVQQNEKDQQRSVASWTNTKQVIAANAAALDTMTKATNPMVASQHMVSQALRDVENQYRSGAITSATLARAQEMAAPFFKDSANSMLSNSRAAQTLQGQLSGLVRQYQPLSTEREKYATDLKVVRQAEAAGLIGAAESATLQKSMAASFEDTTKKIEGQTVGLEGWARSTEHHLRAIRLLYSFVIGDVIVRLGMLAIKTLDQVGSLQRQADAVSLTTEKFQEYRALAGQVGMSADGMQKAFESLDHTVGEIETHGKTSAAAKLFKRLGVEIDGAALTAQNRDALFKKLIDRLGQVHDKSQQAAAGAVIFGEQFSQMGELVDGGSKKVEELQQQMKAMGLVLSNQQIQDADKTAKKLSLLWEVLKIQLAEVVVKDASAIESLATGLAHVASVSLNSVITEIGALVDRISDLLNVGEKLANFAENLDPTGRTANQKSELGQVSDFVGEYNYGKKPSTGLIGKALHLPIVRDYANMLGIEPQPSAPPASVTVKLPPAKPAKGPNIDLKGVFAPKGPHGPKAKYDEFEQDLAQEKERQLQLEREATGDLTLQNEIDKEIIDLKLKERIEQINKQVHSKALTATEGKKLKSEAEITASMEKEAADRKMRIALIEQANQYADETTRLDQEALGIARALARTDDERKRLDLAILDSKQQQALSELQKERALAVEAKDEQRVAELTAEIAKMRANQLLEITQFDIDHLIGIDKFKRDLPSGQKEIGDAIKAMKFDLFNQKLQQAAQFADDIGGAFGRAAGDLARLHNPLDVLRNLVTDLADTFTKNFIEKPITDWAKDHIGVPLAKQGFGKGLTKLGDLNPQQLNVALAQATGSLTTLAGAAGPAGPALTTITTAATPLGAALTTLTAAATEAAAALQASAAAGAAGGGGLGGGAGGLFASLLGGGGSGVGSGLFDFSSSMDLGLGGLDLGGGLGGNLLGETFSFGFAGGGFTGSGADHEIAGPVHKNEYVWDAPTTRQWMPVLQLIGSGKLPSFQGPGLGQMMGRGARGGQPLTVQFGDVHLHGVTDERIARQSANQFMSHVQRRTAHVVRKGLNN